jgi:hypothetical protein
MITIWPYKGNTDSEWTWRWFTKSHNPGAERCFMIGFVCGLNKVQLLQGKSRIVFVRSLGMGIQVAVG